MKRLMNNAVIYKSLLHTVFCVINEHNRVILGNENTNTGQCFSPDGGIR